MRDTPFGSFNFLTCWAVAVIAFTGCAARLPLVKIERPSVLNVAGSKGVTRPLTAPELDASLDAAITDVLQDLGFSIRPKGHQPGRKPHSGYQIWTDQVPLDREALAEFRTSRTSLRLSTRSNIFYAYKILVHHRLVHAREPRGERDAVEVKYVLLLFKRGKLSRHIPVKSRYNNLPILNQIHEQIMDRVCTTAP